MFCECRGEVMNNVVSCGEPCLIIQEVVSANGGGREEGCGELVSRFEQEVSTKITCKTKYVSGRSIVCPDTCLFCQVHRLWQTWICSKTTIQNHCSTNVLDLYIIRVYYGSLIYSWIFTQVFGSGEKPQKNPTWWCDAIVTRNPSGFSLSKKGCQPKPLKRPSQSPHWRRVNIQCTTKRG